MPGRSGSWPGPPLRAGPHGRIVQGAPGTSWILKSLGLSATSSSANSRRTSTSRKAFQPSPNHSGLAAMSVSPSPGLTCSATVVNDTGSHRQMPHSEHLDPAAPCWATAAQEPTTLDSPQDHLPVRRTTGDGHPRPTRWAPLITAALLADRPRCSSLAVPVVAARPPGSTRRRRAHLPARLTATSRLAGFFAKNR